MGYEVTYGAHSALPLAGYHYILPPNLLYNKNEYMFAEVCSENVMGVWFGRWPVCDSECESS